MAKAPHAAALHARAFIDDFVLGIWICGDRMGIGLILAALGDGLTLCFGERRDGGGCGADAWRSSRLERARVQALLVAWGRARRNADPSNVGAEVHERESGGVFDLSLYCFHSRARARMAQAQAARFSFFVDDDRAHRSGVGVWTGAIVLDVELEPRRCFDHCRGSDGGGADQRSFASDG